MLISVSLKRRPRSKKKGRGRGRECCTLQLHLFSPGVINQVMPTQRAHRTTACLLPFLSWKKGKISNLLRRENSTVIVTFRFLRKTMAACWCGHNVESRFYQSRGKTKPQPGKFSDWSSPRDFFVSPLPSPRLDDSRCFFYSLAAEPLTSLQFFFT